MAMYGAMKDRISGTLVAIFLFVPFDIATFIYLVFFDGYVYNSWNWVIAIPCDLFLAQIWPIYWAILHWLPR
jgi:hypothetical protein